MVRVAALIVASGVLMTAAAVAAPRTLRGTVTREGTSTPIAGASLLAERGAIAVTDVNGYFAIVVEDGPIEVTVAATGYQTRSVRIVDGTNRIELAVSTGAEVIEVIGKAPDETKPLHYELTVDEIQAIPGAGNDILRAATVLPGVARIPFSFGGLVLRGASPRDTAVFLDGIEVPIAFHFGGITAFYPSSLLSDLSVVAGGQDVSFGHASGGVVTLASREPRADRWRMGGSIGLFDSSLQVEGPWKAGGVLIGVRRSYLDRIVAPFVAGDTPLPSYYDFELRTAWGDPRKRGRITPMIVASIDRVTSDELSLTSMFVRVAAPYTRQHGAMTLRIVPWLGTNRLTFTETDSADVDRVRSFRRPYYPAGVQADLTRDYAWGHVRTGVEIQGGYLDATQVNISDDDPFRGTSTLSWTDVALWTELRWRLDDDRFAIKPGLRVETYGLTGELVADPRLNLHQQLTPDVTLRQAIGRFHQPPIPGDLDPVDGNPRLDSSYTDQIALGIDAALPEHILATATGYFNYGRGIGVKVQNPQPGSNTIEPNLGGLGPTFELLLEKQLGFSTYREAIGRSRSYGLEVLVRRNVGRLFALVSYTLARSERTDDPRVHVGWRAFELDQRHNLQLAGSYQLANWRFGARAQIVTGNPYTREHSEPDGGIVTEAPFGARLPVFYSIDLRADRRWHRCWGDIVFYIDVQNVTNHRNVEGRVLGFSDSGASREEDIRGLPIIPFIGVEFRPLI